MLYKFSAFYLFLFLYTTSIFSAGFNLIVENDFFLATDEEYTGGIGFELFIDRFNIKAMWEAYTPKNTNYKTPPKGQRSYAAFHYLGIETKFNFFQNIFASIGLYKAETGKKLGIHEVQRNIHNSILELNQSSTENEIVGWNYQISNWSGMHHNASLVYKVPFFKMDTTFEMRVLAKYQGGDFINYTSYGVKLLFGSNIESLSVYKMPHETSYFYLFGSLENRLITKNVLLEGYTIKLEDQTEEESEMYDNHGNYIYAVELKNQVFFGTFGVAKNYDRIDLQFKVTYVGKEYKTQHTDHHKYASISIGYRW